MNATKGYRTLVMELLEEALNVPLVVHLFGTSSPPCVRILDFQSKMSVLFTLCPQSFPLPLSVFSFNHVLSSSIIAKRPFRHTVESEIGYLLINVHRGTWD